MKQTTKSATLADDTSLGTGAMPLLEVTGENFLNRKAITSKSIFTNRGYS